MANKIPVGATIAHAYGFAFRDFFKLLGVMWVPWAILMAGSFLLLKPLIAASSAMLVPGSAAAHHIFIYFAPFWLVIMIFLAMQIAGITELALGLRTGSPYYYFSLGKPLWRVIGAFLLLFLLAIGCWIILLLGDLIVSFLASLASKTLGAAAAIITAIIGFGAYFYMLVRSSFVLIPVAIAEQKISLKRAWNLTRGNFWRIFLVMLSVLVPALVLEFYFMSSFMLHDMPQMQGMAQPATPQQLAAFQASLAAWNAANMRRMMANWYWLYPLFGVFTVIFYGVVCGGQAFAYRILTQDAAQDTP